MVPNKLFSGMLNVFHFKDFDKFVKRLYFFIKVFIAVDIVYLLLVIIFPYQLLKYTGFNAILSSIMIFCPFLAYLSYRSSKFMTDGGKQSYLLLSCGLLDGVLCCLLAHLSLHFFNYVLRFLNVDILSITLPTLRNVLIPCVLILPAIVGVPFMNIFLNFLKSTDTQKGVKNDFKVKVYFKKKSFSDLTFFAKICTDEDSNTPVKVEEYKRLEGTLVQGATGTGKTSTVLLPMAARDVEKKYIIRELSKELGFSALEKGIAKIAVPVSNEELNKNFSLRYFAPIKGKEKEYEEHFADVIRHKDKESGQYFYKDGAVVILEPDGEYIKKFQDVADSFGVKYLTIDPLDENSVGINPFIGHDPAKVASIISNVLKGMYESDGSSDSNLFFTQVTQQALENIAILLKIMYPKMNNGEIPTLEDMLECLHNYTIIETMCDEMKRDPILNKEYDVLIAYFEKNFYNQPLDDMGEPIKDTQIGSGRKNTEKFLYGATTQLDNILRNPNVNRLLCSRTNNIDFDKALEEGISITACSRRGYLSSLLSKAFGMFFILAFQDAVLRRPGNENTRIPFFFYIDEFPDFVNKETETCFTLFRKYRCGMIVAIQNLSQLERTKSMKFYKKVVISNTKTKIVFGNTNLSDSKFWEKEFGQKFQWSWKYGGVTEQNDKSESVSIDAGEDSRFFYFEIQALPFKHIIYKTFVNGTDVCETGITDFLGDEYFKEHPLKEHDFSRYIPNGNVYEGMPDYDYSNIIEPEISDDKVSYNFKDNDDNLEGLEVDSSFNLNNLDLLNNNKVSDDRIKNLSEEEIEALSDLMFETAMGDSIIPTDEDISSLVDVPDIDINKIDK